MNFRKSGWALLAYFSIMGPMLAPANAAPGSAAADSKASLLRKAKALSAKRKLAESLDCCNQILKIDPACGEAYDLRGQLKITLDQPEEGIKDLQHAITLGAANCQSYQAITAAHLDLKQFPAAIEDLTQGIKNDHRHLCDALMLRQRAELYAMLHDYKKALVDHTLSIKLHPGGDDNWTSRGNTYFAMGQYQKAVDDYTVGIKQNPQFYKTYGFRAAAYKKLGKNDLAAADQRKADLPYKAR